MKKKIANAVELILLIISYIILNIGCMEISTTKVPSPHIVSAIDCMKSDLTFIAVCVLYALCAIMCIISIFTKSKHKDGKAHSFVALFLFLITSWNLITSTTDTSSQQFIYNNFPGVLFEIILLLVVIIAFAKRSTIIAGSPVAENADSKTIINNIQESSTNADELKKYKELFDMGAITQEEFDAKKKELLGL